MIDELIGGLASALAAAGLAPPLAPASDEALVAVKRAVAPLRLPEAIERLWRTVEPTSLAVNGFPPLLPPNFCLFLWEKDQADGPGAYPRCLFPLCYESWAFTLVELASEHRDGGELWSWSYGGGRFVMAHRSVEDWLAALTDIVLAKEFTVRAGDASIDVQAFRDRARRQLASYDTHPLYPDDEIGQAADEWPEHWVTASGLTPARRRLRGRTHTIAEIIAGAASPGSLVTIAAHVDTLGGSADGSGLSVSDETGRIRLFCPAAAANAFGPVIWARYEFDIVVELAPPPEQDRENDDPVEALVTRWQNSWAGLPHGRVTELRFIEHVQPT